MIKQIIEQERKLGRVFVEETIQISRLETIFSLISKKYGLDNNEINHLLQRKKQYITVPATIFNNKLSPLETLVLYIHIQHNLNQTEISNLLNRDHTTIWTTLSNALRKIKKDNFKEFIKKIHKVNLIPINIFSNRKLSILENVATYLKKELNYHQIAFLTGKNDRTIWTVIHRAKQKI